MKIQSGLKLNSSISSLTVNDMLYASQDVSFYCCYYYRTTFFLSQPFQSALNQRFPILFRIVAFIPFGVELDEIILSIVKKQPSG